MGFCSSITKEILRKSINYGKAIITIEEEVRRTIFHARTTPLFDKSNIWLKTYKSGFDVTMGSYGRPDERDLLRLCLLDVLTNEFGKDNMVLSRDDGLDLIKIKNKMCKIFRENALNITVIPLILLQKSEQQDIIYK